MKIYPSDSSPDLFPYRRMQCLGTFHLLLGLVCACLGIIHVHTELGRDSKSQVVAPCMQILFGFLFAICGCFGACLTRSRRESRKCLRNCFLVGSVMSGIIFAPGIILSSTMLSVKVVAPGGPLVVSGFGLTYLDVAIAGLELLVAAVSATVCCCCGAGDYLPQIKVVLVGERRSRAEEETHACPDGLFDPAVYLPVMVPGFTDSRELSATPLGSRSSNAGITQTTGLVTDDENDQWSAATSAKPAQVNC